LNLIKEGKLNVKALTSHRYKFDQAESVYKELMQGKEDYIGILYEYDQAKKTYRKSLSPDIKLKQREGSIRLGLIGAGSYAGGMLYPRLKNYSDVEVVGVAAAIGPAADKAAKKLKAPIVTTDYKEFLKDKNVNTVFITTRHNYHAEQVITALQAGKHVFVEKPLALSMKELEEIRNVYLKHDRILFVGYNRRFSALGEKAKQLFIGNKEPLNILYRVNAGFIPKSHWIQDPGEGGGRVIGEVCHFIDFFIFLTGSKPIRVHTTAMAMNGTEQVLEDNISVVLRFSDGSMATLIYTANGDVALEKEYIEIFGDGKSAIIKDFKELELYADGKKKKIRLTSQDKGQSGELKAFFESVKGKSECIIPFEELYATSYTTFKILESLRVGQSVELSLS
jgi:predicted dehydrogenase